MGDHDARTGGCLEYWPKPPKEREAPASPSVKKREEFMDFVRKTGPLPTTAMASGEPPWEYAAHELVAACVAAYARGALEERKAIVDWMRQIVRSYDTAGWDLSEMIQLGEHRKTGTK